MDQLWALRNAVYAPPDCLEALAVLVEVAHGRMVAADIQVIFVFEPHEGRVAFDDLDGGGDWVRRGQGRLMVSSLPTTRP